MKRPRFDAIVVGAGTAGCVVAARLAEDAAATILLVEAGPDLRGDPPDAIRDAFVMSRDFDWGYRSEPDERGEIEDLRRLKLVGGTSSIVRFALRGAPEDFDHWAALGNPGWSWKDVEPTFRAIEFDLDFGDRPWHGQDGAIPVTRYPTMDRVPVQQAAREALVAAGFQWIDDHNAPGAIGAGPMPMSSRDGQRVTTAMSYLPAPGAASKITIRPDTLVDRIELDGGRATGIRLADGSIVEASLVVLSAGTYGSPAILQRSGIGPADHLIGLGVNIAVDLPRVGENLADHPGVDLDAGYRGPVRPSPRLHDVATFRSSEASSPDPPDLMLWIAEPVGGGDGAPVYEIDPVLLTPRSRGSVRLRSSNPEDPPRITLPGLNDPSDVRRLAEGYERAWEVASRPELRRLCQANAGPDLHGPGLRDAIRAGVYSYPHVVGTCAMGPDPATGAVVNARGAVYGVDGLYVADASVIPEQVSGFSHLVTVMLAERIVAGLRSNPQG